MWWFIGGDMVECGGYVVAHWRIFGGFSVKMWWLIEGDVVAH